MNRNDITLIKSPRVLNSVADIPADLTDLTAAELARCFLLIGFDQRFADQLTTAAVDGRELTRLTSGQLSERFHITPFDAAKISRFFRGWRPS
jgi:hypothetical protein